MAPADINWVAVAAGTAVYQVLQLAWYSRFVLGGLWAHGLGYDDYKQVDRRGYWVGFGISALGSLVAVALLDVLLDWYNATTAYEGALLGGILALGGNIATGMQQFHLEERPIILFALNALFNLFALAGIGAVLMVIGGPTAA